jgi:membrane protease subunit HflK
VPKARGDATRMREAANAYRERVIAQAEGETSRFLQTLEEYEKAPEITRKRLYLETMEYVMANASKVIVSVPEGNNIMYIPLDKVMDNRGGGLRAPSIDESREVMQETQGRDAPRSRNTTREGRVR